MRRIPGSAWGTSLGAAIALITPSTGIMSQGSEDPSPHSAAELIPGALSIRPGEPFDVALRITLDSGWHSYWKNPGDAGQPASIDWDIPAGYRVGKISWPYPHKVESSSVVSYGYDDEVMLLTQITPPRFVTTGQSVEFAAQAHWLVCEQICLPAMADLEFEVELTANDVIPNRQWQASFAESRRKLPVILDEWHMNASRSDDGYVLEIFASEPPWPDIEGAFFYPSERGVLDHGAQQPVSKTDSGVRISLARSPYARGFAEYLRGVLVLPTEIETEVGKARAVAVDVAVASDASHQ